MKPYVALLLAIYLTLPSMVRAEPVGSTFTYQGELRQTGVPANGPFDFVFNLFYAESGGRPINRTGEWRYNVDVVDGHFTVQLDFGAAPFNGEQVWLAIWVREGGSADAPTALSPRQKLTVVPYALHAASYSGTIDVSQITGLLGEGYSLQFPDLLNNLATLEVQGIVLTEDVVVITGPGVDIEVIEGFGPTGLPLDQPGVAAEHPFVIETGTAGDVTNLKAYFDTYESARSMSLIIDYGNGSEFNRVNLFEYEPDFYEPATDGRTRFHWRLNEIPDNQLRWEIGGLDDLFQDNGSFNPATDKKVELGGILNGPFFPEVVDNPNDRTLTFNFTYNEGGGIVEWVRQTVVFAEQLPKRAISVIDWTGTTETGRTNYFETFPIRVEMTGFGSQTKLQGNVVVKYAWSEPAN